MIKAFRMYKDTCIHEGGKDNGSALFPKDIAIFILSNLDNEFDIKELTTKIETFKTILNKYQRIRDKHMVLLLKLPETEWDGLVDNIKLWGKL